MEQVSIDQAKKVVDVLADVSGVAEKMLNEKGGMLSKLSHLMPLSGDLVSLAGVDFAMLKKELGDLDAAEKQALLAEFKAKFQLDDKSLEAKLEEGLALAVEAETLVERVIAFGKALSAPPASVL